MTTNHNCLYTNKCSFTTVRDIISNSKDSKYLSFILITYRLLLRLSLRHSAKLVSLLLAALIFISCGSNDPPKTWPSNGTVIKNIKWEVPLSDSLNVLNKEGDLLKLPLLPKGSVAETTFTTYRTPQLNNYNEILGGVSQEVVHSTNPNTIEFYRFEKGAVYFLGYTNPDTVRPLTVFDPPLLIMPDDVFDIDQSIVSTSVSKKWDKESFEEGFKTSFKIIKKQSGSFITEKNKKQKAVLCEMIITQDAGVPYGETNLIMPDAITMKSSVLITEDDGPVLEWGIRSRKIQTENNDNHSPERDLYIEITKHKKETK